MHTSETIYCINRYLYVLYCNVCMYVLYVRRRQFCAQYLKYMYVYVVDLVTPPSSPKQQSHSPSADNLLSAEGENQLSGNNKKITSSIHDNPTLHTDY